MVAIDALRGFDMFWLIDLCGWRRWAFPFVAIGCNSILAYIIAAHFMPAFNQSTS